MARETLYRLRSVGEEGSKAKVSWVQSDPTTPCWTPAPALSKSVSCSTLVNQRQLQTQQHA